MGSRFMGRKGLAQQMGKLFLIKYLADVVVLLCPRAQLLDCSLSSFSTALPDADIMFF